MKSLKIISASLLIVFSLLIPNHYPPWQSFIQQSLSVIAFFLILIPNKKVFFIRYRIMFFLFVLLLTVSYSLNGEYVYILFLIVFFTIISSYNEIEVKLLKSILISFLLASFFSVLLALQQWLSLSNSIWVADLPPNARPFANLGQPNNLATLLCIGVACALYFFEKGNINRISGSILTAFLLIGIVLTQSRTPWLACIAVLFFWTWKYYTVPEKPRLTPLVLFSWCVFFAGMTLAFPFIAEMLLLQGQDLSSRTQAFERWDLYKQFYYAVLQGPIWGYGVGQVAAAQIAITPDYPVPIMTFYTHNIVLDILVWFGPIIGGVITIICGIWLLRLGWHAKSTESLFSLVAAGFILTHSMLEYPHAYAYFLLPLGFFLGIAQIDIPNKKIIEIPRWTFQSFIGLLAVLGSWIAYEYIVIEEDFRLLRFETANIGTAKADKLAPDVILLKNLSDYSRFARTAIHENMTDVELEWMRKVAHNYPYAESLKKYIFALAINNKITEASQQLVVLKGLHKIDRYAEAIAGLQFYAKKYPHVYKLLSSVESSSST